MARPLVEPIFRDKFFSFSAGMARDICSKKPVPAKPWKKLISAEKQFWPEFHLEKPLEFWLEIPCNNEKFANG